MLLASVVNAGMADTKKWPRGDRFWLLPTSRGHAFESLALMSTFSHHSGQPLSIMAATGLAWTWPAPALHAVSLGTPLGRVVSVGPLAKLTYAIKRYILTHPRLHLKRTHTAAKPVAALTRDRNVGDAVA